MRFPFAGWFPVGSPRHGVASIAGCRHALSATESTWLLLTIVIAAVWAFGVYAVQEVTLLQNYSEGAVWQARATRLTLDFACSLLLTAVLPRWLLCPIILLSCVVCVVVLGFSNYTFMPLSSTVITLQWREGLAIAPVLPSLVDTGTLCFVCVWLIAIFSMVSIRQRFPSVLRLRFALALTAAVFVADIVGASVLLTHPPDIVRAGAGTVTQRLGVWYGYTLAWLTEARLHAVCESARRVAALGNGHSDRLAGLEDPFQVPGHICIVQVESLDEAVVRVAYGDYAVTPFLNQLAEQGMYFRVQALHWTGSCDADFTMLTGRSPIPGVMPYSMPELSSSRITLPTLARCAGFKAIGLHGNTGEFFRRRNGWALFGFNEVLFQEELEDEGFMPGKWGIDDHHVLPFVADVLNNADEQACVFVITMTSHTPFRFLDPDLLDQYCRSNNWNARQSDMLYFANMRYVDDQIRQLVTAAPADTTFIFYGDHQSAISYEGCDERSPDRPEYVPFIVYRRDERLCNLQQTRGTCATSGELNLLDCVNWVRASIACGRLRGIGG